MNATDIATHGFIPISAATGKEVKLAMQRLWLVGRLLPVGARLLVRHTFRSDEKKPLEVIYAFGLPRDAALRRFRITGEGFSVRSELKPVEQAVEAYERGLEQGHLAALARQYRDGVVNLSVGNIRPREEVTVHLEVLAGVETHDDGLRFRFPFTLAPRYHSKARMAEVRSGVGEIELPEDEFGDLMLPQFASDASSLHEVGFDLTVVMPGSISEVSSPSHPLRTVTQSPGRSRLSLATAKDTPDRDLVLDVRSADPKGTVLAGADSQGRGRFAALIPSPNFGGLHDSEEPRRIVFVLDRSGSMSGAPIAQARKALEACLAALDQRDLFGIVAFDDTPEVFRDQLVRADAKNREKAADFLSRIDARGSTELAAAFSAAARIFDGEAGDIMVLTDGQVSGIDPIIDTARSTGLRVHCLGIGSAGQDYFLTRLARETDALSRSVTPRERVDLTAVDLFAAIGRPLASDLDAKVEGFEDGSVSPAPPKHVFSGTPLLLFGETSGQGEGRLRLNWTELGQPRGLDFPLDVRIGGEGETLRLLQGARLITDLEGRIPEAEGPGRRTERRGNRMLENLSRAYGLASRAMSLVAVVERKGDRPGELPTTRVVPVGMPQDVDFGAYFSAPSIGMSTKALYNLRSHESVLQSSGEFRLETILTKDIGRRPAKTSAPLLRREKADEAESELVALAARIEPDGGLPGKTEEERVLASILAVLRFLSEGHTWHGGAFRVHVQRLVKFLESVKLQNEIVRAIIDRARAGTAVPGEWTKRKPEPSLWSELAKVLGI
jgi:Ca-activated chloride channel family protein